MPVSASKSFAGLFVTGTDTNVGKTFVTAAIARALIGQGRSVGAYKPACSGSVSAEGGECWEDVEALFTATGERFERSRISPQRFRAPLAPPIAAKAEGRTVDANLLREGAEWWRGNVDLLLVEGVGGLLCPLTETETVADLASDFHRRYGWPLLVIARATLGTINHTLLTLSVAAERGLPVAGVLLNEQAPAGDDASIATNADEITRRSGVPVLGIVPHHSSRGLPADTGLARIDWWRLSTVANR